MWTVLMGGILTASIRIRAGGEVMVSNPHEKVPPHSLPANSADRARRAELDVPEAA